VGAYPSPSWGRAGWGVRLPWWELRIWRWRHQVRARCVGGKPDHGAVDVDAHGAVRGAAGGRDQVGTSRREVEDDVLIDLPRVALQRYSVLPTGLLDLVAGRREDIPPGAECGAAFTVCVARLGVADEAIQRVTVIGDLGFAVAPRGRAEQ
jgi:hypothetical protein